MCIYACGLWLVTCECIRAIVDGKLKWQRISASLFEMNENEYADLDLVAGQFSPPYFYAMKTKNWNQLKTICFPVAGIVFSICLAWQHYAWTLHERPK